MTNLNKKELKKDNFNLNEKHHEAINMEEDYEKIYRLTKRGAEKGNHIAQCNVGYMYLLGQGVEENAEKAVEWLSLSLSNEGWEEEQNVDKSYAICTLAKTLMRNNQIPQFSTRAVSWFTIAATEFNHPESQQYLFSIYKNGLGEVTPNKQASDYWFNKAYPCGKVTYQTTKKKLPKRLKTKS